MTARERRRGRIYGSPDRWCVYRDFLGESLVWVASSPDPDLARTQTFWSFGEAIGYAQRMAATRGRIASVTVYPVERSATR